MKFYLVPDPPVVTPNEALEHALDRFLPSPEPVEIEYVREKLREMGHDVLPIGREA